MENTMISSQLFLAQSDQIGHTNPIDVRKEKHMKRIPILSVVMAVFLWAGTAMATPTTTSVLDGIFDRETEWAGYYASGDGLSEYWGGQGYDVEYLGLYITADEVFFGLQTGYPLYKGTDTNWTRTGNGSGDLALDINGRGINTDSYDYAIRFHVSKDSSYSPYFNLFDVLSWTNGTYADFNDAAAPYRMDTGTQVGGNFPAAYRTFSDSQGTHFVLEGSFLRSYLGSDQGDTMAIHWTMYCGNDYLKEEATAPPVPEPATMLLLGVGLSGLGFLKRKKLFKHA
jgi:hypothetical protein